MPRLLRSFLLLAVNLLPAHRAPAQPPAAEASPADRDPKAMERLEKAFKNQASLGSYAVDARIVIKMSMQGMNLDTTLNYSLMVERPNKFVMRGEGKGMMAMTIQDFHSDGTTLTTYMPMINVYTTGPAPARIEELNEGAPGGMAGFGPGNLVGTIASGGDTEAMLESIREAKWVGTETVNGSPCDHVRIVMANTDVRTASDMWISQGDKPLLMRMAPDLSNLAETASEVSGTLGDTLGGAAGGVDVQSLVSGMKSEMEINFTNWRTEEKFAPELFKFTPPDGSRKVDSLLNAVMENAGAMMTGAGIGGLEPPAPGAGAAAQSEDEGRPEDLEGRVAPTLDLPLREGGRFNLEAQRGKARVVLCFFSPTSAPSAKAVGALEPALAPLKDVTFVPVAMMKPGANLDAFVTANPVKSSIAVDETGAAGALYRAETLPQTVVIGKDGKIMHVRIGFSSKLAEHIKTSLAETP